MDRMDEEWEKRGKVEAPLCKKKPSEYLYSENSYYGCEPEEKMIGYVTKEIGSSLGRMVHGQGRKDISSPVGIVQASSDQLQHGWLDYLSVLGLISLSLALLNLLPLLPLDGGHIAFSIIEGVRGRAVRREIYERVSAVGIVFVLLLFVIGLSNDIGRL